MHHLAHILLIPLSPAFISYLPHSSTYINVLSIALFFYLCSLPLFSQNFLTHYQLPHIFFATLFLSFERDHCSSGQFSSPSFLILFTFYPFNATLPVPLSSTPSSTLPVLLLRKIYVTVLLSCGSQQNAVKAVRHHYQVSVLVSCW